MLEEAVRLAAEALGLGATAEGPFLELEATEEISAISPDGRGKKVRLKAVDETGEMDLGEFFVPDDEEKDPR